MLAGSGEVDDPQPAVHHDDSAGAGPPDPAQGDRTGRSRVYRLVPDLRREHDARIADFHPAGPVACPLLEVPADSTGRDGAVSLRESRGLPGRGGGRGDGRGGGGSGGPGGGRGGGGGERGRGGDIERP